MQATRNLVRILVELATSMQHAHDDFRGRTLGLMLVVKLDPSWDTAAIVRNGNGVIGVDGHHDVVTMPGQGFVNRVIHDFKNHVVQASSIGGVANVHPRPLANRFQTFQLLDAVLVVSRGVIRRVVIAHQSMFQVKLRFKCALA